MVKLVPIRYLLNFSYIFLFTTIIALLDIATSTLLQGQSGTLVLIILPILTSSAILGLIEVLSLSFFSSYIDRVETLAKDKKYVYLIALMELLVVPILLIDILSDIEYLVELLILYVLRDSIFLIVMSKL